VGVVGTGVDVGVDIGVKEELVGDGSKDRWVGRSGIADFRFGLFLVGKDGPTGLVIGLGKLISVSREAGPLIFCSSFAILVSVTPVFRLGLSSSLTSRRAL